MKDSIKPVLKARIKTGPSLTIGRTNVLVANQGYTYNETGFIYNQAIQYGGIYGFDIIPMITKAKLEKSSVFAARDFSGTITPTPYGGNHTLIGMLGLTYS